MLPVALRADVWDKGGGLCHYCGVDLNPFRNFSPDHLVPRILGGTDDPSNLVAACRRCNLAKNDQNAHVFRYHGQRSTVEVPDSFATNESGDDPSSLRAWRAERMLSQDALALAAEVSNKTVNRIEQGLQVPTFRTIGRISRALAIEPGEVVEFARALRTRGGNSDDAERPARDRAGDRKECTDG